MILVRDVFRLKFGKAKEARALMREGMRIARKGGGGPSRHLIDLVGPYYTLVLESTHESLAAWESSMGNDMGGDEMAEWYERFKPVVESGYREIFTVLDDE
jgi:hypothetical protein